MRTVTTVETLDRYGKTVWTVVTTVESDEVLDGVIESIDLRLYGKAIHRALLDYKQRSGRRSLGLH